MRPDLEWLSQSAVKVRYPGESATRSQARLAVTMMKRCREEIGLVLGLPVGKHRKERETG